jgi:hypothetical protein
MRALALALVLPVVVALPALAHADRVYAGYEEDRPPDIYTERDHSIQPELGFGALIGKLGIGRIAGQAIGFHLDGGVRWNRLAALAEYDFFSFDEDTDVTVPARALIHRAAINARYSFGVLTMRDFPVRGDFWVEAGAGHQLVLWYDGGKLHRNDVSIGIGAQATIRFGEGKRRKLGLYYAVKFIMMDRPDLKMGQVGCGGPCDEPTPMIPIDLGIFFNMTVPFGL